MSREQKDFSVEFEIPSDLAPGMTFTFKVLGSVDYSPQLIQELNDGCDLDLIIKKQGDQKVMALKVFEAFCTNEKLGLVNRQMDNEDYQFMMDVPGFDLTVRRLVSEQIGFKPETIQRLMETKVHK